MSAFDPELAANAAYAASFADLGLSGHAARGLAVVTCMDSRIDPLAMLGLQKGDAKILRTAGARITDDVLTSLVLAHHALGADRVLVVAHTDCGMVNNTDADVHALIEQRIGVDARSLVFDTVPDQRARLERDLQRIRSSPYLPREVAVGGGVYDVRTGRLELLVET